MRSVADGKDFRTLSRWTHQRAGLFKVSMTTSRSVSICPKCNGLNLPTAGRCIYCQAGIEPSPIHPSKMVARILICFLLAITLTVGYWLLQDLRRSEFQTERNDGLSQLSDSYRLIQKFLNGHSQKLPTFKSAEDVQKAIYQETLEHRPFISYATLTWNTNLSGQNVERLANPNKTWLIHTNQQLERGQMIVLFLDGHQEEANQLELGAIKGRPLIIKP